MASNRDPRPSYRRRSRKTITSSSNRSTRSKKSTAPKPTSSSTRSSTKGSSTRVTTGLGGSRAKVKIKPKSTGLIGTRNTPATKTSYKGPKTPGVKFNPSNRVKTAASVGTLINPKSDLPAKALAAGSLVKSAYDATRKSKTKTKMKPSPGMAKGAVAKAKSDASKTNRQSKAASFDRSFAAARKAGKSTFTWKGKKYNTKLK